MAMDGSLWIDGSAYAIIDSLGTKVSYFWVKG
jgi:hypothetical protein